MRASGLALHTERQQPAVRFRSGVAAFVAPGLAGSTRWLTSGRPHDNNDLEPELRDVVRGYFENGGAMCAIVAKLDDIVALDEIDIVCLPALPRQGVEAVEARRKALDFCALHKNLFAILDPVEVADADALDRLDSPHGALYDSWLVTEAGTSIVPCGHIAGLFSRLDRDVGPHRAPANQPLLGVVDVSAAGMTFDRANQLVALAGRGVRPMGSRTLSSEPAWDSIGTRRTFNTIARYLEHVAASFAFEPNDIRLWLRVTRELEDLLLDLFHAGAFKGATPEESYFVRCDASTNPADQRDLGGVRAEVGLAITAPAEYIIIDIRSIT